ncbi:MULTISPECIES: transporter substrate-binding domain-containing protein [unclassified Streptomyces]|uniref:transporter substrate-binding domain-containing protein n=1 Tax=unclassified Streptomyces TaxID=2593676 RepID=UPI00333222D4
MGELQGETAEANDFARWLRKITNGVGVRQLESDFPYSKSLWTQFRNGSRLIPRELLDQVVSRYLHEPAMRQRQVEEGHRLLEEALRSAARPRAAENGSAPAARPQRGDAQAHALLRLDDARLRQIEAMRRLHASERRCDQLQDLVSELERRCTLLEHERDRARDEARAELQRQVQMSAEYRRQADLKLKRARRAREEAYELRLAAEAQVARAQLDVLQRSGAEAEDIAPLVAPADATVHLSLLGDVAPALHAIDDELDENDQGMDALRAALRLPAVDRSAHDPRIVQGVVEEGEPPSPGVVRVPTEDNADSEDNPDARGDGPVPGAGRRGTTALCLALAMTLGMSLAWDPLPAGAARDPLRATDGNRLTIGVAIDAPGLSELDDGGLHGFEVDMGVRLAQYLGFDSRKVSLTALDVSERAAAVRDGRVDVVIARVEVTNAMREQVKLVGPYVRTYHGVLVGKENKTISTFKDLAGRNVCTRAHSMPQEGLLKDNAAVTVTRADTRGCVAALRAHQVEAVIDDQVVLYGYTEKFDDLEVPPAATDGQQAGFYAIALPKETPDASCRDVFRALQQYVRGPWKSDFQSRLGSVVQAFPTTWNAFTPSEGDMNERSSCSA